MEIFDIMDNDFLQTINNNDVILIDYWATWCAACVNIIDPILNQIATERDIPIGKYNVGKNDKYIQHIRSLPTLVIYKYGKKAESIVGAVPKPKILRMIDAHII